MRKRVKNKHHLDAILLFAVHKNQQVAFAVRYRLLTLMTNTQAAPLLVTGARNIPHPGPNQHNSCATNNCHTSPIHSKSSWIDWQVQSASQHPQRFVCPGSINIRSLSEREKTQEHLQPRRRNTTKGQNLSRRATVQRKNCTVFAHEWFLIFGSTRLDANFETIGGVTMRSPPASMLQWGRTQSSAVAAGSGSGLVAQTATRLQIYNTLMPCSPSVCCSQARDPLNF